MWTALSGNTVTNGPWRVPSGRPQNHVGSGARASWSDVPGSHASFGSSGASGTAASTETATTCAGGVGGGGRGAALGLLAAEPQAVADVKMKTTVWERTTSLLCTNRRLGAIRALRWPQMTARNLLLALLTTFALTTTALARPRPGGSISGRRFEANKTFGLGLELGAPTAINGKYFLSADRALDFGVGSIYSYSDRYGFDIYGDYLFHPVSLASNETFELPLYIGPGVRFLDFEDRGGPPPYDSAFAIGFRVPIGISFDFNTVPLDIFVQLVPTIDFFSGYTRHTVYPFIEGSIGIRYWFN
jgi:hypothetical protein